MKTTAILTLLILSFSVSVFSQQSGKPIKIYFKNISILPKKLMVISYTPGDVGNGTQGFWMWPGGTKVLEFKEGTKVYLAHQKQVDTVMAGKRIDNEKPFLIVEKNSKDQVYKF